MAKSKECEMRDQDGFQIVKRKGHRTARPLVPRLPHCGTGSEEVCPPAQDIASKIRTFRDSIRKSQFFQEIQYHIDCSLFREFVCYGIGHLGTCPKSQQQLALLLELCPTDTACALFDPVLCCEEKTAAERMGCTLLPNNEMCKRRVDHRTLFYMPHCGRAMYNNLLWSNWSPPSLSCAAIIGNRLSSYPERISTEQLLQEAPYIHRVLQYCTEVAIPNSYPDSTVFNDLAIHTFPMEKLATAPQAVWTSCTEPIVDPNDLEIIVN